MARVRLEPRVKGRVRLTARDSADPLDMLTGLVAYYPFNGNGFDAIVGQTKSMIDGSDYYGPGLLGEGMTSGVNSAPFEGTDVPHSAFGWFLIGAPFSGVGGRVELWLTDVPDVLVYTAKVISDGVNVRIDCAGQQSGPLSVGWHHWAITNTGAAGGWRRYVDGEQVGSAGTSAGAAFDRVDPTVAGANATNPTDEIGIYSLGLTPGQVLALYNGGSGYNPTAISPAPVSGFVDAVADVYLTFNLALKGALNGVTDFKVRANGIDLGYFVTGWSDSESDNVVRIHLDIATVQPGDVVTVDYVPGVAAGVSGTPLAAFTGFPVINNLL